MVLRTAFVGDHLIEQRWPGFPFEWARKAEYLAVSLGPMILCYFFREIFRTQVTSRWVARIFRTLMVMSAAMTLAVLLLSVRWYNHLVDAMQLNLLACMAWSLAVIVRAAWHRDHRALAVLLSATVFVAAVVNDVLYARGLIITDYVAPLGFAFFLLVQTYLTARDFALSHHKTDQAERAQARGFGLLANVQKNAGMGIWQWDPATDRVLWSATVYDIVGLPVPQHSDVPMGFAGALNGAEASRNVHREDLLAYLQVFTACLHSRQSGATHYRVLRQDGEIRHLYTEVHVELDAQGKLAYLYGFVQDVTEKKRVSDALALMNAELEGLVAQRTEELRHMNAQLVAQNAQLEALSVTDRLTGLFNRLRLDQSLEDELHRYLRFDVPFALLLIDVDHFKDVNDTHGHAVGDQVLQQFAAILGGSTRAVDLVGRWGGEEFLVICRETQETGAMALAEKLRQDVAAFAFPVVGQRTASFGVTSVCAGDTVARMMARADAALYRAKAAGRNRVELERG
jgi:diguanylate cyclase (GGDEF)-like protein